MQFITGASKGIGYSLAKKLSQNEKIYNISRTPSKLTNVVDIQCDITDEEAIKNLFSRYNPDIIYHFAGNPLVKADPSDLIKTNLLGTHNLLKYCPEGIRFVYASSITVYGDSFSPVHEGEVCSPTSVYATTKLASEHLITCYKTLRGIKGTILRLGATVGSSTHGLIPDIIRKLKDYNSEFLELLGNYPGPMKPFTFIDDVVNGVVHFKDTDGTFNLCNKDCLSVYDVAQIVMRTFELRKEILWLNQNWKGDNRALLCDNDILAWHGFHLRYNSEESVREAVNVLVQQNIS